MKEIVSGTLFDRFGDPTDVSWRFSPETGTLEIDGFGFAHAYRWYHQPCLSAFDAFREDVKHVVFGDGITAVGPCFFRELPNLETVSVPVSCELYDNEKQIESHKAKLQHRHSRFLRDYGNIGDATRWLLYSDGTLQFSGKGQTALYSKFNLPPYIEDYLPDIKRVVIGEGISCIRSYALYGIPKDIVTLSSEETEIDEDAFGEPNPQENTLEDSPLDDCDIYCDER